MTKYTVRTYGRFSTYQVVEAASKREAELKANIFELDIGDLDLDIEDAEALEFPENEQLP